MSLFSWIREIRKLRRCHTPEAFASYVKTVLKTPENIGWWVSQNIWYEPEEINTWRSAADVLGRKDENGDQYGNCSEISVVSRFALSQLPGFQTANFCIYGTDKDGPMGHAVAAFNNGKRKGFVVGSGFDIVQYFPLSTPWDIIAQKVGDTVEFKTITSHAWKNDDGLGAVGLL